MRLESSLQFRRPHHVRGAAIDDLEGCRIRLRVAIVVLVESPAEAEPRIEHEGADERAGAVAGALQLGGQRRQAIVESGQTVDVDAVRTWRVAGENRRMRRERHRHVRVGTGVANAGRGELVERRRQPGGAAVGAEPIAPQRVDGHEQHVRAAELPGSKWRRRRGARAAERRRRERHDCKGQPPHDTP